VGIGFPRDKRENAFAWRSCLDNNLKRDGDLIPSNRALGRKRRDGEHIRLGVSDLSVPATLQIVNVTMALGSILTDAFRRTAGYQWRVNA
jgi:hypothetical protein